MIEPQPILIDREGNQYYKHEIGENPFKKEIEPCEDMFTCDTCVHRRVHEVHFNRNGHDDSEVVAVGCKLYGVVLEDNKACEEYKEG